MVPTTFSAISCVPEDFHRAFGGGTVPERALPVRHARAVLDPLGDPFNDRLGFDPYELCEAGVDGLLPLCRCPESYASDVDILRAGFILDVAASRVQSDVGRARDLDYGPRGGTPTEFFGASTPSSTENPCLPACLRRYNDACHDKPGSAV